MVAHFWWATWANHSWSLIFGERPERLAHIANFLWATWAIRSHCSLKKRKWASRSFFKIKYVYKTYLKIRFRFFSQFFLSESLICSFVMSNCGIRSLSLSYLERPELFAHRRSFVLSDLSKLIRAGIPSSVFWANCLFFPKKLATWAICS